MEGRLLSTTVRSPFLQGRSVVYRFSCARSRFRLPPSRVHHAPLTKVQRHSEDATCSSPRTATSLPFFPSSRMTAALLIVGKLRRVKEATEEPADE
eukprot:482943-Hanusia_phi.AAC.1